MRCPHCRGIVPDGTEKCPYCGSVLTGAAVKSRPEDAGPGAPSSPSPTPPYPWREGPGGVRGGFVQRLISWLVVHAWWVALGVIAFGGGLWVLGRSWIAALLWVGALALGMWGVLRLQARKAVHGTMGLALGIVLALFAVHTWQGARPLPVSHSGAGSTALGPHLVGVTAKTVTLHLDGNRPWTDSGLYLTAGETVRVQASGTIDNGSIYPQVATNGPNGQGLVTPSGGCTAAVTPQRGFIAPGLPCWSLIARVGTGEPFWIGTSATWTVHTPGELWFGVNNNVFGSSRGGWTVSVEVSHPA